MVVGVEEKGRWRRWGREVGFGRRRRRRRVVVRDRSLVGVLVVSF